MIHLGDITKINGAEIPVVDCITGGSPCQDLSIAGKRAGLAGERSGLYMEQIRVVKEMREHDRANGRTGQFIRPRWMVWENVTGTFSANKGEDFRCVLEEAIKIAEPEAPSVSVPAKGWPTSGCLSDVDGKWSVAWRVHDAQFWGVPQRRRRIALVADFGGLAAPEVLFERKGLSWDSEPGGTAGERTSQSSERSVGSAINAVCYGISSFSSNSMKSGNPHSGIYEAETSRTLDLHGGCPACNQGGIAVVQGCAVYDARGNGDGKTSCVITGNHANRVTDYTPILLESNQHHATIRTDGISTTLPASMGMGGGYVPMILPFDTTQITSPQNGSNPNYGSPCHPIAAGAHPPAIATYPGSYTGQDAYNDMLVAHALRAKAQNPHREDAATYPVTNGKVRRLTPLECERLQGYPDGWTDIGAWADSKGKAHQESSDSARYKALGNSIALPFWFWILRRISAIYERPATLGSLFDGIGGFPLCWERCNGKGTALWASEIEEFPIAVTKLRFQEDA